MEQIPQGFLKQMSSLLGDEFDTYNQMLRQSAFRGLRVNLLKISVERFSKTAELPLSKTPFLEEGFYLNTDLQGLGNTPLHHAGAFYLQEPSAMSVISAVDPQPNEKILDLCAAPGGKSTGIAARLNGTGLLWSNEFVRSRAQILLSNIERMGVRNAVVSNCATDVLCERLEGFFDKVLVDAPCSGEGMMRKEPKAAEEWSTQNIEVCTQRQRFILKQAQKAVRAGGYLIYSTCTFNAQENEKMIAAFLSEYPQFSLVDTQEKFGREAFVQYTSEYPEIHLARRVFPMDGGEGHFVAVMQKQDGEEIHTAPYSFVQRQEGITLFNEFYQNYFSCESYAVPQRIKDQILLMPEILPDTTGLNILRAGVLAGQVQKNRFEPAHHLYMAAMPDKVQSILDLSLNDPRVTAYLKGEEIEASGYQGYTAVAFDRVLCGFGKASSRRLKNHYPKGLRLLK